MNSPTRGDALLFRHRKMFTLATSRLPVDEAIVTFTVRPSLTKQAGPSREGRAESFQTQSACTGKCSPPGQVTSANDHSLNSTDSFPRMTYHLHAIPTRVACNRICQLTPFSFAAPKDLTLLLLLQYKTAQYELSCWL